MAVVTIDELIAERDELKGRVAAIDAEHAGERFPEDVKAEWNRLNSEVDEYEARIKELELRTQRVADISGKPESREGLDFSTLRPGAVKGDNIYDLSTVRRQYDDPSVEGRDLRDRAKRVIEGATFPHPHANREDAQGYVERLLETDSEDGYISRRIVATGSPTYKRAFGKYLSQRPLSNEENRALSLTTSAGGVAVPFVLDPTIIPTSNLSVNPFRAIARVEQISVDEWRGVSSAGITAAYGAELTEASDNAPVLAQPIISTEKAQAFIPFSIEIGMDWGGLQSEMARLLQDAKDELEATMFATGTGTNQPQGVTVGATATVTTSTGGSFLSVDLFTLEANLPPRFRPRASAVANRTVAQKVRQFDTAGGAMLWLDNLTIGLDNQVPAPGNYGARLIGYGAYESSAMASVVTTGAKFLILGDFSYYVIADRVGMSVELIPHMFATANNRPSGQRGLYCFWRNGAGVVSTNAFRTLQA